MVDLLLSVLVIFTILPVTKLHVFNVVPEKFLITISSNPPPSLTHYSLLLPGTVAGTGMST